VPNQQLTDKNSATSGFSVTASSVNQAFIYSKRQSPQEKYSSQRETSCLNSFVLALALQSRKMTQCTTESISERLVVA
jgi:hypothetical protein